MSDRQEGANKKSRKNANKVRVKLPGIESYEKTLEFAAEGPGRVVVRLERLMGSDRIRITDPKYLATLVERLEAEEDQSWGSRSRLRKKAEKNRSRQLAIEGLMEPAEDMQDLYEHPVFRVNRVLNRLAMFDHNFAGADTGADKLPPIIPVEPFTDDLSGKVFKSYPQHQIFHRDVLPYDNAEYRSRMSGYSRGNLTKGSRVYASYSAKDMKSASKASQESIVSSPSKTAVTPDAKSTKSLYRAGESGTAAPSRKPSDLTLSAKSSTKIAKKRGEDDEEEDDEVDAEKQKQFEKPESLKDFRKRYDVPSEADLVKDWQAFRSHLVNRVYEESGGSADELYSLAGDVIGTYDRQLETVDDFVADHEEKVKDQRRAMGLPSDPNVVVNQPEPEAGENAGEKEDVEEGEEDVESTANKGKVDNDEDEDEEEIEVDEDELEEGEDAADNEVEEDNAEE